MSHQANDDFTPDRDRVADADDAVPVIAKWSSPR
jgi:hypothetical protein